MAAAALRATPLNAEAFRVHKDSKSDAYGRAPAVFAKFIKLFTRSMAPLGIVTPVVAYEKHERSSPVPHGSEFQGASGLLVTSQGQALAHVRMEKVVAFGLCELVFGGSGSERPYAEERPLSHIEQDIASHFISLVGEHLPNALEDPLPEALAIYRQPADGLSDPPAFLPVVTITLNIAVMGYSGEIEIDLAEAAAGCLRPTGVGSGDAPPAQSSWTSQIAARVESSEVELLAVLTSFQMTLQDLSALQPGQTVRLATTLSRPVSLESDGVAIHKARLGQQARRFCLSVL